MLQMGLAGAAATGLGTWAAGLLPAQTLRPELRPLLQGAVAGFISCQVLVFGMLRFTTVRRPPGPHRVNRTLAEGYRTPCLRAHELDTDLADRSPDTQTRDGLGEVAAWVYRLQWTLQDIDQQVATLDEPALRRRIQTMSDEAARTEDGFTADRKRATVQHLRRLLEHIHGLRGERTRTAALADYASAFLEEARAGLALAHLQPGEHIPPGLHDVLHRLRNHAQERDAHRQTADEMATLTA